MANKPGNPNWKKGVSGNPNGRPKKGETLTEILRDQAELVDVTRGDEKISRKEALARRLWSMAMDGDIHAIKYIYDRIDGTPTGKQELTGAGGGPIELTYYPALDGEEDLADNDEGISD